MKAESMYYNNTFKCLHKSVHFLTTNYTPVFNLSMNIRFYIKVLFKSLLLLLLLKFVFFCLDIIEKDKIHHLVNVAREISSKGTLILTFTNLAQLPLAKHFICNLKDLKLKDSTLLVASDITSHFSLLNFERKIKTIFLPSHTEKKDLTYGSRGFKDFIEYRYTSCFQN